ncbi:flagellar motor protein [Croceibacterium mercuriale]|uniref:Flagellar motor protein n=1 Tax=Croceibacterium mercuriale TaxID=1572751 RepID=A0A0B2C0B7_9SPHN|nr:flagellar motor protein MotB [Croceibacterium mercuriale]KHL25605.1 flagellar motor protein [Croceibacterium mercuriale]
MAATSRGKNDLPPPIIVKKVTVVAGGGHHGGAWKVAYADFVTAMMAFFLLLWLLGATTEKQKRGLADYFTPTLVKTKEGSAGSNNGLLGGSSLTEVDKYPNRQGQTGTRTLTIPRDVTGGPKEGAAAIARMREKVAEKLAENRKLQRLMKQVKMVDTTEGIRIDLVDDADFSMFQLGTTVMTADADALVRAIAATVADEAGMLTVRGHTDALQWRSGAGNNWALSSGRAEATRQAFVRHGIMPGRFRRIEGVADREPLVADNPADPRNRRISILLGS